MTDDPRLPGSDDDLLKGWKEIAQFLRISERTVQRWEQTMRLPIYRVDSPGGNAVVYATRRTLRLWLESSDGKRADALRGQPDSSDDPAAVLAVEGDTGTPVVPAPPAAASTQPRFNMRLVVVLLALLALLPAGVYFYRGAHATRDAAAPARSMPGASGSTAAPLTKVVVFPFRITGADGNAVVVGVQAGGTATYRPAGRPGYVLSAEATPLGARLHVSEIVVQRDGKPGGVMERLVIAVPRGTRVTVDTMPGLAAIELIEFPKR